MASRLESWGTSMPWPRAERLCLDFANTVDWRLDAHPHDLIADYEALVRWSQRKGIVGEDDARRLAEAARTSPALAREVHAQAVSLRETIFRVFSAVARRRPVDRDDLATLNAALAEALIHLRVAPAGEGFRWAWAGPGNELDRVLWPIAHAAGTLLVSANLARVRMCAGDRCGWLFLDTSRNQSRKWCSMESCGNRAKARRHYRQAAAGRRKKIPPGRDAAPGSD